MKSIELISGLEILSKVEAYKIKGGTDNKELVEINSHDLPFVLDTTPLEISGRSSKQIKNSELISKQIASLNL